MPPTPQCQTPPGELDGSPGGCCGSAASNSGACGADPPSAYRLNIVPTVDKQPPTHPHMQAMAAKSLSDQRLALPKQEKIVSWTSTSPGGLQSMEEEAEEEPVAPEQAAPTPYSSALEA